MAIDSKQGQSWSIVVVAFNEQESLQRLLPKIYQAMLARNCPFELIIVDDGSTDGTANIALQFQDKKENVLFIRHPDNRGIGAAYKTGYRNATKENVCVVPGDGEFPIEQLAAIEEVPAQTVISFFRTEKPHYSLFRHLLSKSNTALNQLFFQLPLRDVNWVKVYKRADLAPIALLSQSTVLDSEICVKLQRSGCRFMEFPSLVQPRKQGASKGAAWKNLFSSVCDYVRLLLFP